ncbi:MAG: hypothetical protein VCB43_15330 [Myxococcota bacterium]
MATLNDLGPNCGPPRETSSDFDRLEPILAICTKQIKVSQELVQ